MKIDVAILSSADDKWNDRLKQVPEGHLYQTSWWADYIKSYIKADPFFIVAKNEPGEIVGQLLLFKEGFAQRLFFEKPFATLTVKLLKRIFPRYNWLYGPVIFDKTNEKEILSAILKYLEKNVFSARSKVKDVNSAFQGNFNGELVNEIFAKLGYTAKPWATFLVDLKRDQDVLWANLKKTGRKAVQRCEEQNIIVKRIRDEKELHEYYDLLFEAKTRLGYKVTSFANNIKQIWKHLRPINAIEVFLAYHNNKPVSGLIVHSFNGIINEMGVAHSNYAVENKIYAQDLIKWEIIKWGHEQGHRIYDLTGVNPNPQSFKEKGIYQFKEKWGGNILLYSNYNLFPRA